MIPMLHNDYFKYYQMFKGNYGKGASLLRSILNDETAREMLMESVPALAAIFTDFNKCEATHLCYNVLSEKGYLEQAVMAYLKGIGETEHDTMEQLRNDAVNIISLICNDELFPLINEDKTVLKKLLNKKSTLNALKQPANVKALFNDDVLSMLSDIATKSYTNIYTTYKTFADGLIGTSTSFSSTEEYEIFTPLYDFITLDDTRSVLYLPVTIRCEDISTSKDYYYPAVFRYSISSKAWTLLYVADTSTKVTSSVRGAKGVAYDSANNHVYLFYRKDATAAMNCDIIDGSTGALLNGGITVGDLGNTSYLVPYFCHYDTENNVAKFVWSVDAMNSTNTTYGWLYGCSVDLDGLVWQGIAAKPTTDTTSYSSEMHIASGEERARCSKAAFVGSLSTSSSTISTVKLAFVVSEGIKMVSKYVSLPESTEYSDFYTVSTGVVTEDGLFAFTRKDADYAGSNVDVLLVIDMLKGQLLLSDTSSYASAFTLYNAPVVNKLAYEKSNNSGQYVLVGTDADGKVATHTTSTSPEMFDTNQYRPLGTDRYRLYTQSSTVWRLYDFKGGFV